MKHKTPRSTNCPMTITRERRMYLATVHRGEATSLQGDESDVKLEIKEGCPKSAYLMEVRTDVSKFGAIISNDECFISPIVEVLAPAETSTSSYTLRIPHCLHEGDDRTKVKVWLVQENRNPAVVDVPKGNAGPLYYDIDARFIELHTTHRCPVLCTICQTPYHCRQRINSLWYARLNTQHLATNFVQRLTEFLNKIIGYDDNLTRHDVEIRSYFCGDLQTMDEFRKVTIAFIIPLYVTFVTYMSHFSYACKMRYPLNFVLESWKYLWSYLTFWVVIADGD